MSWFSTPEAFTTVLNFSRFLAFTLTSGLSISPFRNSIDSLTRTTHTFRLSFHSFRRSCYFLQFFKVQRLTLLKKPSVQIRFQLVSIITLLSFTSLAHNKLINRFVFMLYHFCEQVSLIGDIDLGNKKFS